MQGKPGRRYRDIIWGYLNERSKLHMKKRNFGLYRNCRLTMSQFVREEGRLESAFSLLAEVIRYDLSGLSNGFDMDSLFILAEHYFPYSDSVVKMAPGIADLVAVYQENRGLTVGELREKLLEQLGRIELPFSLFTPAECVEIVMLELGQDEAGLAQLYEKAEKRFRKRYGQSLKGSRSR